jgi:hypothetical protein
MALYRHRAGFKPQRVSSFGKWVKAPEKLREVSQARAMIPFFVLPCTLLVMLASSTSGEFFFVLSLSVQTTTKSGSGTSGGGW